MITQIAFRIASKRGWAGFDRVLQILFDIDGDRESYKNVKYGTLSVFSEAILRAAQNKLPNRGAVVSLGRILGR